MADVDRDQGTEPATPRRRERSRHKGEVAHSADVVAAAVLLGALAALLLAGGSMAEHLLAYARDVLGHLDRGLRATSAGDGFALLGWVVMPVASAGGACALLAGFAQSGGLLSTQPLVPDLARIDPIQRFKQLFLSSQALIEVAKSLVKFVVVGALAFFYLREAVTDLCERSFSTSGEAATAVFSILTGLALRIGAAFAVMAAADWTVERFRFERRIRMTKHEVREEMKEEDGDPLLRRRRRQRHRELVRRRSLAEVARADVVLVNPTEYAVALRYEPRLMRAPKVVAKGRLHLADRIREIARGAGIPIVREPPLTRLLYHTVEAGREIPVSVYHAVAEVLAYVYRLRRGAASAAARLTHGAAA